MTTYKELHGTDIEVRSSDPQIQSLVNSGIIQQQIRLRVLDNLLVCWASGGNLNTARSLAGGSGTQTAALAFGGNDGSVAGETEQYDGSSWTEVNDMNTARQQFGGCGTQVLY